MGSEGFLRCFGGKRKKRIGVQIVVRVKWIALETDWADHAVSDNR